MQRPIRINARLRRDPTRTTGLRKRYVADMGRRFRGLKKLIRTTLVDYDALRIDTAGSVLTIFQEIPRRTPRPAVPRQDFEFTTSADKVDAFMEWMDDAVDRDVLEVWEREGRRVTAHSRWQNVYVRSAYVSGINAAEANLKRAGLDIGAQRIEMTLRGHIHADALGLLYTRNFEELKGITEAMSQRISRELAQGLAEGKGRKEVARRINNAVDKIGVNRSRVLARTEMVRAHAEATLNRYEDWGIPGVMGLTEFATAGDERVCDKCEYIEGEDFGWGRGVFPIDEARGIIPVHPQCRCTWLPVIDLTEPPPLLIVRFSRQPSKVYA